MYCPLRFFFNRSMRENMVKKANTVAKLCFFCIKGMAKKHNINEYKVYLHKGWTDSKKFHDHE